MTTKIPLELSAREKNDLIAKTNKQLFQSHGLRVYNLISSPGAGKTTLLEKLADLLKEKFAVIVGDLATTRDADRIKAHGSQAVQIETGGGCHLNAEMVQKAFQKLDTTNLKLLIIENVGNLVCPAAYELGEDEKIAMLSLPEGDDKPAKYPSLFLRANLVLISKTDLSPVMDFNLERAKSDCLKLNAHVRIIEISTKAGNNIDTLVRYLMGK